MLNEVREWLHKASEDVRTAEVARAAEPPLLDAAAFHCQQAADPTLRAAVDRATPLTEYAWKFRYPGIPDEPSTAEVEEALAAAREICLEVVQRVPDAARP